MDKKIKIIIIVMIVLTLLDILISVLWLSGVPIFSIFINLSLIGLIIKYSKRKKISTPVSEESTIDDSNSDKIDIKKLAPLLLIPFASLAVVLTYVFYLLSVR